MGDAMRQARPSTPHDGTEQPRRDNVPGDLGDCDNGDDDGDGCGDDDDDDEYDVKRVSARWTWTRALRIAMWIALAWTTIPLAIFVPMAWTLPCAALPFVIRKSWVAALAPIVVSMLLTTYPSVPVAAISLCWLFRSVRALEALDRVEVDAAREA
jgi:hypothetical protein